MRRGITPEIAEKIRIDKGIGKGTKLRVLRVQRGLSQLELAKLSDIPINTLRRFESCAGTVDHTKLDILYQLCSALDCKITDILDSDELIEKFNKVK